MKGRMSQRPTPYDGSAKLFQIGVRPLGEADWIEVDEALPAYLAEKERLLAERRAEVFAAEAGTEAAQAEVLALLAAHLPERFPAVFQQDGEAMEILPAGRSVRLDGPEPPLLTAARLVQEDLILMRHDEAGWRLVAGSLSFPSSWSLREKFGRPIHEVHAPVPGFGAGTRNAEVIARMFNFQRPETPVLRWNWSVYDTDRLFHPETAEPGSRRFGTGERAENVFLRVERQTLRKLPGSGDILFTIRITVDPLSALEQHQDAARIAGALVEQLNALDDAQVAYKGLAAERARLVARLKDIASR